VKTEDAGWGGRGEGRRRHELQGERFARLSRWASAGCAGDPGGGGQGRAAMVSKQPGPPPATGDGRRRPSTSN